MSILFGDVANRLSHGTCNDVVLSLNDVTRSALQGPRGASIAKREVILSLPLLRGPGSFFVGRRGAKGAGAFGPLRQLSVSLGFTRGFAIC